LKDFLVTIAGVMLGTFLFVLILGSPGSSGSLKSETGNVMKSTVQQMHQIKP
jgi:hypothetical protein